MKLGFVVECTVDGPDEKVYPLLARRIRSDIEIYKPVTMGDKRSLITECGPWVATLLQRGCDLVLIAWDLRPRWKEDGVPCLTFDRTLILQSLTDEGVDLNKVGLVCNITMLEAWLLADKRAIKNLKKLQKYIREMCPVFDILIIYLIQKIDWFAFL